MEVTDLLDGRSRLLLANTLPAEDVDRFENGELVDSTGVCFPIESNTQTEVVVHNQPSGTIPSLGLAEMWDDDYLRNGDEVPEPDLSQVGYAMAEAFIDVYYAVDDGLVPFQANLTSREAETLVGNQWGRVLTASLR